MSFNVNWKNLETDSLRSWTVDLLTGALNSGNRPNILASDIVIKDLNFGKVAPDFEILEIGELGRDRFRGIFKITYSGDFHLTLHTKVQANPLKIYSDNSLEKEVSSSPFITPDFLLSVDPFNLPMDLKLSDIKISGIGIIVYSKSKGLTLVFRNDPLDSIKVSSTFDTVQVLANFLQKQIENQIGDLFRETLPTLIHKVSLKYTSLGDNDLMDNLKEHLTAEAHFNMLDSLELENISPNNLNKLAKLHSSRETLNFGVPKFKKIVQRNHLEKFNKNMSPNLYKSLLAKLNLPVHANVATSNNSVPVDLFMSNDYKKVDDILTEIAGIQTRSFNSGSNDNRAVNRRRIKLGSKSKKAKEVTTIAPQTLTASKMSPNTTDHSDALSDASTVMSDDTSFIKHPTPVKVRSFDRPPLRSVATSKFSACPSPLNSNSSFVGSVGLGNSFFQIANGHPVSASPLRSGSVKPLSVAEETKFKVKQTLNRVDIRMINEKLQEHIKDNTVQEPMKDKKLQDHMKMDDKHGNTRGEQYGEHKDHSQYGQQFEHPPPPYHQLSKV